MAPQELPAPHHNLLLNAQRRGKGTGRFGECKPLAPEASVSELSALIESVDVTGIQAVERDDAKKKRL